MTAYLYELSRHAESSKPEKVDINDINTAKASNKLTIAILLFRLYKLLKNNSNLKSLAQTAG